MKFIQLPPVSDPTPSDQRLNFSIEWVWRSGTGDTIGKPESFYTNNYFAASPSVAPRSIYAVHAVCAVRTQRIIIIIITTELFIISLWVRRTASRALMNQVLLVLESLLSASVRETERGACLAFFYYRKWHISSVIF